MTNEIEIMIGQYEVVKSFTYTSEEFNKLKSDLNEVESTQLKHWGISRIWKNKDEKYYIEFYNKVAFKFNSKEDLERMKEIEFVRIYESKLKDQISYISNLDEPTFKKLKESGSEQIEIGDISWFGKFYQLKNSEIIIVEWTQNIQTQPRKEKYSILENIRTMIGLQPDLIGSLPGFEERDIENLTYINNKEIEFNFQNGVHTNAEEFRTELADVLNISMEKLDYSIQSLNQIDKSYSWNMDNLHGHNLLMPFHSYLGEILIREKSCNWYKVDSFDYWDLISDKKEKLNLLLYLKDGVLEDGLGLEWAFETILEKINKAIT